MAKHKQPVKPDARMDKQPPAAIAPKKRRMFWLLLAIFPFLCLFILEMLLRLFTYGGNTDLVVKTTIQGKEYYTLNREVARRYFSQKGVAIPEAYDDLFQIDKAPNTKRIFMLGESTMQGFPYEYNATPARLYQDRLKQLLPHDNIEVINVGLSAVNSYTVLDFVKELVHYKPDAFVIYLGHNEFYGALGVGSTEYLGQWRGLVNLYLELRTYRTFQLLKNTIAGIKEIISPAVSRKDVTLMEAMVRNKTIAYHSKEYNIAMENFEKNLEDIAEIAKSNNVPVIISTLASNIRDQKPLIPLFSDKTAPALQQEWESSYRKGIQSLSGNQYTGAMEAFRHCIQIDSTNADAFYQLGRCYDSLAQYPQAKEAYTRARDLDGLRFRAASECNQLIRSFAEKEHLPLADAERAFEKESPHGLVGSTLMLEHLHPNFDGYCLLAKTFYQTTIANELLAPKPEWHMERDLSDSGYKAISGVTDFDTEEATIKIFELKNGWPFRQASEPPQEFHATNKVQEFVLSYIAKSIAWSEVRKSLAQWYVQNDNYEKARKEYYAISKVMPYYYLPEMDLGDMYRMLNKPDSAEACYKHAAAIQESPFIHVRLGMLYFEENATSKSINEFESVFANQMTYAESMKPKENSKARYFLGMAYGKSGNFTKAKENFQLAIQIDPGNTEAQQILKQLH